ncbi:1,2-phenylacetyl-CoA epoxidase subunit PaaD [Guptibacillus hwajinpoensis]|uniref:1,2-phenylacetyl-CoA epoxidase subunit PaaD n=1 Tax=Guptibacillus hwajinpoensis TaxID=208199 RepID=UPI001CFCDBD9|nr:1,2-phenylacetyl-CoA epoxidase subunit PaaD [Pseudalkalibacillus hwajinpoensis]WLR58509.1 1,2-phenylacetyl-CoA epoxidase subunit PaaD [Pseudalkalibacillus hwajinpoensis]
MFLKERVMEVLETVKDPEIPVVSVVDLGIIHEVHISNHRVTIEAMPTFSGCPALDMIKRNIELAVESIPEVDFVTVTFIRYPIWTTNLVSTKGREALKKFGIAPPEEHDGKEWRVPCPYCESVYTTMDNIFGPAACRSILYCRSCKNPFEAMKPVSI